MHCRSTPFNTPFLWNLSAGTWRPSEGLGLHFSDPSGGRGSPGCQPSTIAHRGTASAQHSCQEAAERAMVPTKASASEAGSPLHSPFAASVLIVSSCTKALAAAANQIPAEAAVVMSYFTFLHLCSFFKLGYFVYFTLFTLSVSFSFSNSLNIHHLCHVARRSLLNL